MMIDCFSLPVALRKSRICLSMKDLQLATENNRNPAGAVKPGDTVLATVIEVEGQPVAP
jgi:hypothetical protein